MARYLRVLAFFGEVLGMVRKNPTLLNPIYFNIALTVPMSLMLAVAMTRASTPGKAHVVMGAGLVLLYFMDYFCNAMTASLVYDEVREGNATLGNAFRRTARSTLGLVVFAALSGVFDLLASYAQAQRDPIAKAITRVIYAVWTTAVYMVLPSMVIEGVGFGEAFRRSKEVMQEDPTEVGVGVIALSLVNWVLGAVCFNIAYFGAPWVAHAHPLLGGIFFYTFVNLYWALAGFLKSTYFTCFYLWAERCADKGSHDFDLAPAPLANALTAY
jgi:hypothetical protein